MKYINTKCIPILYNIYLDIDLLNDKYTGYNIVNINIIEPTNNIQFHAQTLYFTKILLNDQQVSNISIDSENDIYTIQLNSNISGDHVLKLYFNSIFDEGTGLVKINNTKDNRTFIYTRFEPNFSRKCFPCWDEPCFKVKYNMKIQINDPTYQVLFNTDPINISTDNNLVLYEYQESIVMSTYVSSFIIAKFNYIESFSNDNIRLRIYIPDDLDSDVGNFALDCGVKMLNYATKYFNISFPYNKIDFIPIDNVDVRGMENYGLIFYDSNYLLYDKKISTLNHKIGTAHVIAHELVHQWFGNLISIINWNELWLKESFAKFFEYIIVDAIFPDWNIKSNFVNLLHNTIEIDSIGGNSIKTNILSNRHIIQIYDDITYMKGAALLFMLNNYLGTDYFKKAIQNYIFKYKHSVINSDSFIESLCQNHPEKELLKKMINEYITNKGLPILSINDKFNIFQFNSISFINNILDKKSIFYNNKLSSWILPIYTNNSKQLISNNSFFSSTLIYNNYLFGYYIIVYDKYQFDLLINNFINVKQIEHISILNNIYLMCVYNISPINYFITYVTLLINKLLSINNKHEINYYLILSLYKIINNINSAYSDPININFYQSSFLHKSKQNFIKSLKTIFNQLINNLYILFDSFNINIYLTTDFYSDNIQENLLILFLLNLKSEKSNSIIHFLFDNNKFDISADLNKIIFKKIIENNDHIRINKLSTIIDNFPYLHNIIFSSFLYTKNNLILDNIIHSIFYSDNTINHTQIKILLNNSYFLNKYSMFFIDHYDQYIKKITLDSKSFLYIIYDMIINQIDINIVNKLIDKLYSIDNTKFILKMTQAKNILLTRLFKKINIIKLFY